PVHREMEYALPLEKAGEAMRRLRAIIEQRGLRVNFVVELRFVAADDVLLSPDHGRASCRLGAYMYESASLGAYFREFEAAMLELDGRPHWGKEFTVGGDELCRRLPGYARFDAIRRRLDPQGTFVNAYVQRVFGEK